MIHLMSRIKEDTRKKNISGITISKLINVSRGMVSNYLNNETEIPILKFVDLIKYVYKDRPDIILDLIKEFISKASRKDSMQELLEWISNRGNDDLFKLLYNKFLESNELMEDFKVYNLLYKRNMRKISETDFYIQVEKLKENKYIQKETKTLLKIATLYSFWDLKSYNMMFLADDILLDIKNIDSEYLKKSFKIRTLEMLATAFLKRNNKHEVIRIGEEILCDVKNKENFPIPIISIYMLLAEVNVFDNPVESLKYITKGIDLFNEEKINSHSLRKSLLESTYDFIKIHNNCYEGLYLTDQAEKAHYLAKIGKSQEAINVLNELEKKNGKLSAHQYYYKGLATKDIDYMKKSLSEFINIGDSFHAQLPNMYILNQ